MARILLALLTAEVLSPVLAAVTASTQCLSPVNNAQDQGCSGITTKDQCLGARDGRSLEKLTNRKIKDEPCVWCAGQACTSNGPAVCEPRDWLNGAGTAFTSIVSTGPFEIADCLSEQLAGVECLTPVAAGCQTISDATACSKSRDGREARFYLFTDLRIRNQPCVWCGGASCTNKNQAKCEPQDYLMRGAGSVFPNLTATTYTAANCASIPASGLTPSGAPSVAPTVVPTVAPTVAPGQTATLAPTLAPGASSPTAAPTLSSGNGSSGGSGTSSGSGGLKSLGSDSGVKSSGLPWWAWLLVLLLALMCIAIPAIMCMPTKKKRKGSGRTRATQMVAAQGGQNQLYMQPSAMDPMPTAMVSQPVMQPMGMEHMPTTVMSQSVMQPLQPIPTMSMQPVPYAQASPYMQPMMAQVPPHMQQQQYIMPGGYAGY